MQNPILTIGNDYNRIGTRNGTLQTCNDGNRSFGKSMSILFASNNYNGESQRRRSVMNRLTIGTASFTGRMFNKQFLDSSISVGTYSMLAFL